MVRINRFPKMDSRAWSTATWAVPFVVQLVLGTMFIALWLLGKVPPFVTHSAYGGERIWFLAAAAVAVLVSVAVGGWLLTSRSLRVLGVAVSVAGSAVVVLVGTVVFGFWTLR